MIEGLPIKIIYCKDRLGQDYNFYELEELQGALTVDLALKGFLDIQYLWPDMKLWYAGEFKVADF